MTDLDFPKGMPYPLISSAQISLAPTYERVQFDAGNSRNVPGRDSVPEYRTLQFLMTNEQLAIFTLWYRVDAANGAKNFNLEVRTELGLINQVCRFAASGTSTPYTREPISSNHWRLTFPVEYLERKTIPVGWPSDSEFLKRFMEIDILVNKVWPKFKTRDFTAVNTRFGNGNGSQTVFTLRDDKFMPMQSVESVTAISVNDALGLWELADTPRSNLTRYSNSEFVKSTAASLDLSYGLSPTGDETHYFHSSPSYSGYIRTGGDVSYIKGQDYVISIFCRPVGGDDGPILVMYGPNAVFGTNKQVRLRRDGTATGFNSPKGFGVESLYGGWYRAWVCVTATTAGDSPQSRLILGGANDDTNGWEFFGFQIEEGAIPTPYIPTDGVARTVVDYTVSGINVTLAIPPAAGSTLRWSGLGVAKGLMNGRGAYEHP